MSSRWQRLWHPSNRRWTLYLPLGALLAFFAGGLALGTFQTVVHLSNENEFCYSCHLGMDTIVEEYQASIHYENTSGVVASCADCHVPIEFWPKMRVKFLALGDVLETWKGTVTLENFESHRLELAQIVWEDMKATDSRECRNCHNPENWRLEKQSAAAQVQHDVVFWVENNKTCVNCHHGIAHLLPLRPGSLMRHGDDLTPETTASP
ncbi:NapC/NirT family cytochrome c [Reinekea sp. G2M2-21]|uniref:NapC/NirT family cytochrome c n=1 Tax=Reinekea sp. G2M2-21 TaxID=2788942 RepID=UPI0018A90504|nr:NapC/NirT family cytochrome c [Reinekea sp. G2M2-21]